MSEKIIERDKYEGQPFIDKEDYDVDMVTGRLLKHDGEQYGWYAINKVPDSEQMIDYCDPGTFEVYKRLCSEYIIRQMNIDETQWKYMTVWLPIKGVEPSVNEAFERAMKVIEQKY